MEDKKIDCKASCAVPAHIAQDFLRDPVEQIVRACIEDAGVWPCALDRLLGEAGYVPDPGRWKEFWESLSEHFYWAGQALSDTYLAVQDLTPCETRQKAIIVSAKKFFNAMDKTTEYLAVQDSTECRFYVLRAVCAWIQFRQQFID